MKYYNSSTKVPKDVPVWGCAYGTNKDKKSMATSKKPVLGIVKGKGWYCYFYELKKDGTLKESSRVNLISRYCADTYEESVEIYNELVMNKVQQLLDLAQEHKTNLIVEGV